MNIENQILKSKSFVVVFGKFRDFECKVRSWLTRM